MSPKSTLRALVQVLSDAVDSIENQYASAGLELPSLDDPFDANKPSNSLLFHPNISQQASIVIAAAEQLSVSVRAPLFVIQETSMSVHKTTSLFTAVHGNVPEILREAGPKGLHVKDIGAKNGMDPDKIARILRVLATYHIFTEVSPDVFANNRISSVLDTGKPTSELTTPPTADKYIGSNGAAAFSAHIGDETTKAAGYMAEFLTDKSVGLDSEQIDAPFNRAFNVQSQFFFSWMQEPANQYRSIRFNACMKAQDYSDAILRGFPWESLPAGSKVVDVGGGLGSVSLSIYKKFPHLKFVVQDLPPTAAQAQSFWEAEAPKSITSGSVAFNGADFFQPQTVRDADIFMLRVVLHDWSATQAIKILKRLREAAVPGKTRVLMVDSVVPYATKTKVASPVEVKGFIPPPAPEPLLSNLGRAASVSYLLDVQMIVIQDGQERTINNLLHITKESGWKISCIYSPIGTTLQHIVADAV